MDETFSRLVACLALMSAAALAQAATPVGQFEDHADIGNPKHAGAATYNAASQEYLLTASGTNMWGTRDEFHFAWRRLQGDFILQARVEFLGEGVDPHRKAGWIVRSSLDADSKYIDAVVHGDGLTSLQFRKETGGLTAQIESESKGSDVIQLERRGNTYIFSAARYGEPFTAREIADLDVGANPYVGLFLCSHNADVIEQAIVRDVRIIRPAKADFRPYRDYIGSHLELLDIQTGHRQIIHTSRVPFEAPNWTPDGGALYFNTSGTDPETRGRIYRFDLATRVPQLIDTGFATRNNNDHVLSFDGTMLGISDQSTDAGQSTIFTLPARGKEIGLTSGPALDDGPEFSRDGQWIWFNSTRGGKMQLWRMKADGSQQQQVTNDAYNTWFPHFSPDGKWVAMISYVDDIAPTDHPYYKRVYLRLMPVSGGTPKVIAYVYGGQGTINVPSWSPDGRMLAFVSNSDLD